ncbi:M12 family metallopeptidase [Rhodobium gokarnense]|uniref:Peptidase metallopeptidase domain-containing protein n=1 Tax=Rhodobium gokarnense TaxID=364296 RepID=A0ABT3HC78_9HYPH|nr:M12 family metallopeptidase [Rhodobium gokarnense]MCW2308001.1 hypothetical protein [Rhodobium gokarnense]
MRKKMHLSAGLIFLALTSASSGQQTVVLDTIRANEEGARVKIAIPPKKTIGDAALEIGRRQSPRSEFLRTLTKEQEADIVDRAYPLMAAKWPFNEVNVCWEDLEPEFIHARMIVRNAIRDTWEAASGLKFLGWGKCHKNAGGIRIAVEDSGPHVKFLGKFIGGLRNGMVLNFTYNNWSQGCQSMLDYCNRVIAVHEFGHAIGFAHEQNRPDTPGECDERQGTDGDTLLTPWDLHSVMNYCNPTYSNDGVLSEFDILAVQYIYGRN